MTESVLEPARLLVAFDGSPVARAALGYAFDRVGEDGEVIAVYVAATGPREWAGTAYEARFLSRQRDHGREVLEALEAQTPGLALRTQLAEGPAAATLVRIADELEAEEIVVGSRGYGPVRSLVGSVAHALLHETDRPLAVVPAAILGAVRQGRAGVVVVGYDGSPTAKDALAHAAYRAGRDGRLIVVYAYEPPRGTWPTPIALQASADSRALGRELIDALEDDWAGGSALQRELREGPAPAALIQVAREHEADEIVVGSRGHGRFRAALGSVAHALVNDTERPVVVVPQSAVAEEEAAERRRVWVRRLPPRS